MFRAIATITVDTGIQLEMSSSLYTLIWILPASLCFSQLLLREALLSCLNVLGLTSFHAERKSTATCKRMVVPKAGRSYQRSSRETQAKCRAEPESILASVLKADLNCAAYFVFSGVEDMLRR